MIIKERGDIYIIDGHKFLTYKEANDHIRRYELNRLINHHLDCDNELIDQDELVNEILNRIDNGKL